MVSTRCVPTPWGHAVSTFSRSHSGGAFPDPAPFRAPKLIGNVCLRGVEESAGRGEVALASRVSWLTPGLCSAPLPKALIFIHLIHSLY